MKLKLILTSITISLLFNVLSANAENGWDDWDTNTAYRLAVASFCAYKAPGGKSAVMDCFNQKISEAPNSKPDVLNVFDGLSEDKVAVFRTPGEIVRHEINAAILVEIPDGVILAFRGTDGSPQDWLHNIFLISINSLKDGKIYAGGRHYGFSQSLETLSQQIIEDPLWRSLKNQENKTLYITGHSKGGALATGATVDFNKGFSGKKVIYTFEAARFFTAEAVEDEANKPLLNRIWRFEYQNDLVPHVPLGEITYNYLLNLKAERGRFIDNKDVFDWLTEKLNLPSDWLEKNNINFRSAGRLAYVDDDNNEPNRTQPDLMNHDYYKDRAWNSIRATVRHIPHPVEYAIAQHSECYLDYLKARAFELPLINRNCQK